MRNVFKRAKKEGYCNSMMQLFFYPLTIVRDYSIPMSEEDSWDKRRGCVLPSTILISFFYTFGLLQGLGSDDEDKAKSAMMFLIIGCAAFCPGILIGILIYFKTSKTQPPPKLITLYSIIAFVQAIAWINFASNCIVDLIMLFGFITTLPQSLLSLTVLAWGNCLGDM